MRTTRTLAKSALYYYRYIICNCHNGFPGHLYKHTFLMSWFSPPHTITQSRISGSKTSCWDQSVAFDLHLGNLLTYASSVKQSCQIASTLVLRCTAKSLCPLCFNNSAKSKRIDSCSSSCSNGSSSSSSIRERRRLSREERETSQKKWWK